MTNRRNFCKTIASILLSWGLNPKLAYANNGNKILSGKLFIDSHLLKNSFNDLNNNIIETKAKKTIFKVNNDFYLVRPESKLKFISNKLTQILKGSVHAVFSKQKDELKVKLPQGSIGIRGTSIFVDIEPDENRSFFCNCYGETLLYDKNGKLIKSIISKGHKGGAFTDDGKFQNYGLNYLSNSYARKHAKIFDEEMEAVGCIMENSHCKIKL
tara:strand:+ start:377 stop:1015 length:639 start_codon:yes stop_codon:yes gene_type:complete